MGHGTMPMTGMDQGAMNMEGMDHSAHAEAAVEAPVDHSALAAAGTAAAVVDHSAHEAADTAAETVDHSTHEVAATQTHSHAMGPGVTNVTANPVNRLHERPLGLENFHCHLLYHIHAGMMRVLSVREGGPS